MDVSKVRVLILMCGVTKLERIRIERILGTRISHIEETNPKIDSTLLKRENIMMM